MTARALGTALLVEGGPELRAVIAALQAVAQHYRHNGMRLGPQFAEIEDAARQALSANGTAEVRAIPALTSSPVSDPIDTREAARILRCTTRNVTRIATDLDGRRHGRTWIFDRRVVLDYAAERTAA